MTELAPRENPRLFGHAAAEAVLLDAIRTGRMHHAWLLTGPAGVGKATLAFRFARRLFAKSGAADSLAVDPDNPVFRRVAAATHADLLTVERAWDDKRRRTRAEIVVEDVRAVSDFLRLTPAEDGWRVVVIDGAEFLNRSAANALLKVLEEPPRRALLLLACAAPGRLLPTLRSRCRRLRLDALAPADMHAALEYLLPELDGAGRERLAALAEGSPGRALALVEANGLEAAGWVAEVLRAVPAVPLLRAHELADAMGRTEGAFSTFMDLLRAAISGAVRQGARDAADAEQARLLRARPLEAWNDVWHALTRLQDDTERLNGDKRHAVVSGLALLNGP